MISIILPYKTKDKYVERCLKWISYQTYKDYEVIEIPDSVCNGYPAEKRNLAILRARGDYLAFLDSDSYPNSNWLENALKTLNTGKFIGICGPGILPSDSSILEQATDLVLKCLPYAYRVTPKKQRIVPEFPTFNLIVKKTDLMFEPYLTGEDSLYCRQLSEYGQILYTPDVIVYHNRRPFGMPFFRQVARYGRNRGILIALAFPLLPFAIVITLLIYVIFFVWGLFKRGY